MAGMIFETGHPQKLLFYEWPVRIVFAWCGEH